MGFYSLKKNSIKKKDKPIGFKFTDLNKTNMKKTIAFLYAILFLSSCGIAKFHSGYYDINLSKVENPKNKSDRYGETCIQKVGTDKDIKYQFVDDNIDISWAIGNTKFRFNLKNKTDHSIKIIWDDAIFIDTDGSSNRVMHAGIKYTEKENPQTPSVVARGSFLDDMVLPTKNVYLETNPYIYGWKEKYYLPIINQDKDVLLSQAQSSIGKKIKIILPIQIEDVINDYTFEFDISAFNPID